MADADLESLIARAGAFRRAGRVAEAITAYEQLLARRPALPDSWYNLALMYRRARRFDDALAAYDQALAHCLSGPEEAHLNRGVIYADDLRRPDLAEQELATALRLNPRYQPALLNLGNLHEDRGRKAQALATYDQLLALDPDHPEALARAAQLRPVSDPADPVIGRLRRAMTRPGLIPQDRAGLGFALGKLLDGAGAYELAFEAYAAANAATPARYDRGAQEALVDGLIAAFSQAGPPAPPVAGTRPPPIFILGMFRSGSTLAEQVLASHPRVTSGGELTLLPTLVGEALQPYPAALSRLDPEPLARRYLGEIERLFPGADVLTDKRPDNFLHVGLIKRLFPDARIVHTRRHPLDNVLSAWFLHLSAAMPYATDLMDAAHYLAQERRLTAHWKTLWPNDILDLDYDAFVQDPRPHTERLLAHCDLAWDDACLAFHQTDSNVRTASVWQVREPLYQRASGRWRNYERQLRPVRDWLEGQGLL
ncbi:tetratricopeptide repeat-containing sulfotransferase family protein [Caulobacter sp. NIBR1757]|uniref:tetratricopeptide repeat-containing sulfotransferase family protein n=1 Tax=Caulobacter sp. NIBR1757 TaxID=3016000 RepID=UPI0022F0CC84|nr:tetratricopeptide repeat-containing sulfotransferase family protein [Caulobacter sp. NIBR1757]